MQNWNKFPRFVLVLILLISLCASLFTPQVGDVEAKPLLQIATNIVISEFRTRGPNGAADEFVELYNPTSSPINISGLFIRGSNNAGATGNRHVVPAATTLQPGQYYLAVGATYSGTTPGETGATLSGTTDDGGFALFLADGVTKIDEVGMSLGSAYQEGITLSPLTTNINQSYERRLGGIDGNCIDINNNSSDFFYNNGTSNPQNSSSPTVSCGVIPTPQVIISEVAWAGTNASTSHEWIELYNNSLFPVDVTGWRLESSDTTPTIVLNGIIPAGGYLLLERDENATNIPSDLIYNGALADEGESLFLYDDSNTLVDSANGNGGAWPAGNSTNFASMERIGTLPDSDASWFTNNGVMRNGEDFNEDPIWGTPKNINSLTPTPSPTITFTPTSTITPTRTITPTSSNVRSVIINEIAWAGTASGSLADDEWIELYNPGSTPINITGWRLVADDGTPNISLVGTIPAGGYFLLERGETLTDNTTVSDIPADQIYTGNALSNSGEDLTLYDSSDRVIDTANGNGGAWPRGSSSTYGTMERISGTADSDSAWTTNNGTKRNGLNANGGNILGTPKNSNTVGPTPTPGTNRTSTPFPIDPRPIINEILARPGFDWNQDGRVDVFDEFIEIKNLSPIDISLQGWKLDKLNSTSFSLPNVTLKPNERIVFYSLETNLLLSDGGETIRLINPSGRIYDAYTYTLAREEDKSFCRLPDGNVFGSWFDDCIPTPNLTNTREGRIPTSPDNNESPVCDLPDTIPADFFFAECRGYGANIWNPLYWDQLIKTFIQNNTTKWETFIE